MRTLSVYRVGTGVCRPPSADPFFYQTVRHGVGSTLYRVWPRVPRRAREGESARGATGHTRAARAPLSLSRARTALSSPTLDPCLGL